MKVLKNGVCPLSSQWCVHKKMNQTKMYSWLAVNFSRKFLDISFEEILRNFLTHIPSNI